MLAARVVRMLRNKVTVAITFGCIFLYIVCVLLGIRLGTGGNKVNEFDSDIIQRKKEFVWDSVDDLTHSGNGTERGIVSCRNSVQGKALLADDRGYVCQRADRLGSGCCDSTSLNTFRYHCLTCNSQHCCAIYEYCVSCCMDPEKKPLLKRVLNQVSDISPLYASVSDQFELCLVKCRTSSQSVQHETLYRDPRAKHCYGERLPAIKNEDEV